MAPASLRRPTHEQQASRSERQAHRRQVLALLVPHHERPDLAEADGCDHGLRAELGLTVLLIEHDMRVVMGISDRVTVLDYGEVLAEGSPDEVRANPRVVEAYLGRGAAGAS